MPETLLEQVAPLAPYHRHLKALGYSRLSHFLAAARAAGPELSAYLGTDAAGLAANLEATLAPGTAFAAATAAEPRRFPLGVALERVPRANFAFSFALAPAGPEPQQVSLLAQMPAVKDQGTRGTCVAHAALAIVENYDTGQGSYQDFSEQFLYWDCKQNDGHPNEEGTWLGVALPALVRDGCCLATTWPYVMNPIAGNESQDPPPAGSQTEALGYKVASSNQLAPTSVQAIKSELQRGRCVAFSIPVFNSWYLNQEVTRTGDIVLPIPNEANVGGHAMAIFGYENLNDADLGGGRFLIRNSWDSAWATEAANPGCGTIPYAYIASYGMEAYSVD
jgi:hypothetical protein